jgi:diguanylate cyclase (GGDEF)-like protein
MFCVILLTSFRGSLMSNFLSAIGIDLSDVMEVAGEAIVITDNNFTINSVNTKAAEFYGLTKEQLIGINPLVLFPDFKKSVFYAGAIEAINTGKPCVRVGFSERLKKWISIRAYKYDENNCIWIYKEINEFDNKQVENGKQLDLLTSLPNSFWFEENFDKINEISSQSFGLTIVDINRFHSFNETFGREIGNLCLMQLAQKLKMLINGDDSLYKVGPDQFLIFSLQNKENNILQNNKIIEMFDKEMNVNGKSYFLNISMGVLFSDGGRMKSSEAFSKVEKALTNAKKNKMKLVEFSNEMESNKVDFNLEQTIKNALKNNEMELFYQPQADLLDYKVVGAEALIRWKNPETGQYIPPIKFLPAAEELGLMGEIDLWVINDAIRQIADFKSNGINVPISINLSSDSICNSGIVNFIDNKLKEYGVDGRELVVEITETSLMSDIDLSKEVVEGLRKLGVQLSIDDFGTGYSSMGYLLKYPADYLKIDREFVKDMIVSDTHRIMVQNIVRLGHSIGMAIVAEGAETKEEMDMLRGMDCEYVQGFGYSKPLPVQAFKSLAKEKGISNKKSSI